MKIMTIKNVNAYVENNVAYLKLEDVARGLGFVDTSKGTNKIIWNRVDKYLADITATQVSPFERAGFIPENIFYKLCMKANNEVARKFQDLVCDEILPTIRRTGQYNTNLSVPQQLLAQAQYLVDVDNRLNNQQSQITRLEHNIRRTQTSNHLTVIAYANMNGIKPNTYNSSTVGRKATSICTQRNLPIGKVVDSKYGYINTYPIKILDEIFFGGNY